VSVSLNSFQVPRSLAAAFIPCNYRHQKEKESGRGDFSFS
jgi:hypothetical protein